MGVGEDRRLVQGRWPPGTAGPLSHPTPYMFGYTPSPVSLLEALPQHRRLLTEPGPHGKFCGLKALAVILEGPFFHVILRCYSVQDT